MVHRMDDLEAHPMDDLEVHPMGGLEVRPMVVDLQTRMIRPTYVADAKC